MSYGFDVSQGGGGQPDMIWEGDEGFGQQSAFLGENNIGAQAGNKKGKKNDKGATKDKKVVPIVPSYEGYVLTVTDPIRPGETASWIRTRKVQMPLSSQELHDKAIAHQKRTGIGLSGQFQNLGTNQQTQVNRLVAEKNAAEKEANAEWKLFGVKKLFEKRRSTFKTMRVNNAMRVTLRRGDKAKDTVMEAAGRYSNTEIDPSNIVDLREPVVKKETVPKKKKKDNAANPIQADFSNHNQQPHDHGHNADVHPLYPEMRPQQENWSNQAQHGDPMYDMHDMSGALPNHPPPGAIPVPPQQHQHEQQYHHPQQQQQPFQEYRPEVPMAPPPQHFAQEHPFQPAPHVFPQPQPQMFEQPFDDRQPRDPVAYGNQHMSARRPSHSRRPSLSSRRRDSADSDKIRAQEMHKITDDLRGVVRDDLRGVRDDIRGVVRDEVRDEVRSAMRDAAAEDKVLRQWPTGGSRDSGSSRSAAQDDIWSNSGSSGDRRHSRGYSTPGTSPDRSDRYPPDRPGNRRRDSSGAMPYVDERRRYYMEKNKDYVMRPHDTYRENPRDVRYGRDRDRRQGGGHDDYPTAHAQPRLRSRERQYGGGRPQIQHRVTDYPEAYHEAEYRRPRTGKAVDYERTRMNDRDDRRPLVYEERRGGGGGRERHQAYRS
jgi:hypothetical protein